MLHANEMSQWRVAQFLCYFTPRFYRRFSFLSLIVSTLASCRG